jgi:hypothetical protein
MPISFRQALDQDFDYCKRLYFGEMEWIIRELHLDRTAYAATFQRQWDLTQVRIIARRFRRRLVAVHYAFSRTDVCGPPVSTQRYWYRGDEAPDWRSYRCQSDDATERC